MTVEVINAWMVIIVAFGTLALGFLKLFFDIRKVGGDIQKVHILVNNRSQQQDDKIDEQGKEIDELRVLLDKARRTRDDNDDDDNTPRTI